MNKINTTILLLGILTLSGTGCGDFANNGTNQGSGLVDEGYDYIDIYTTEDFLNVAGGDMSAAYRLRADIDLTGEDPGVIGTQSNPFTGVFEGNHKSITKLVVDSNGLSYVGMFSTTEGTTGTPVKIQNLTLVNSDISGSTQIGILIGGATKTEITNVHVIDGTVDGSWSVGQLVGDMSGGFIEGSSSSGGSITASNHAAGGVVGFLGDGADISKSFSSTSVTAGHSVGGLVGVSQGTSSSDKSVVENCYATGSITSTGLGTIGGLVGKLGTNSEIQKSYTTGSITGGVSNNGAFVGERLSSSNISDSYYKSGSGFQGIGNNQGSGSATELVQTNITSGSFPGWNFSTVWQFNETGTWPTLK